MHNQYLNVTPLGRFTRSRKLHPFAVVLATGFVGIFYPILSLLLINAWLLMTIVQMKKQHSEQMEQMRRAEQQNQTAVSKVSHTLAAPLSSIHLGLQSLSEDALSRSEREAELRRLVRLSRWASRTCRRLFQLSQWIHEKPEARPQDLSVLDHLLEVLEVYEDSIPGRISGPKSEYRSWFSERRSGRLARKRGGARRRKMQAIDLHANRAGPDFDRSE